MAKKLVLSYSSNPTVGEDFEFSFLLGGVPIPINGFSSVNVSYWAFGNNNSPYGIGIKPTLTETIDNTLFFLQSVYYQTNLTYTRVNDTIEILMDLDVTFTKSFTSSSFTLEEVEIDPDSDYRPVYFMQYNDTENIRYEVTISKKNYDGVAQLLGGKATLSKGSIENHLDPIIGTSLELELEATTTLDLESLYSDDERTFRVVFKRNNVITFIGYLKPDGVFQSFVTDFWIVNLSCVDGLGFLEDLAFVEETGKQFVGLQSGKDILYYALKRTGLSLPLNIAVNVYYDGLTPSDTLDPLTQMYVSTARFIKDDNDTIMNCKEVISSILKLFNASVTQHNGEWYVWRTSEMAENAYLKFRRYSKTTGVYFGVKTLNLNFELGSQVNNRYPHHCSANQQVAIRGSVSAYRLNYKYGFLKGVLKNPNLEHDGSLNYIDWTEFPDLNNKIKLDPTTNFGVLTSPLSPNITEYKILSTATLGVITAGNLITLKADIGANFETFFKINVKVGTYYLKDDGSWTTTPTSVIYKTGYPLNQGNSPVLRATFETKSLALPTSGIVEVELFIPKSKDFFNYGEANYYFVDVINSVENDNGKIGEFHTAVRKTRPSSIAKETETIYNGDSPSIVYEGAIYKADKVTPTSTWFRRGKIESYEILRICVEDVVRMQQKPAKIFTGDAYGYIPYFCLLKIDNINAIFAFLEYSYDSSKNITTFKALEVFGAELSDIDYKKTFDYGKTVKPTIKSY